MNWGRRPAESAWSYWAACVLTWYSKASPGPKYFSLKVTPLYQLVPKWPLPKALVSHCQIGRASCRERV